MRQIQGLKAVLLSLVLLAIIAFVFTCSFLSPTPEPERVVPPPPSSPTVTIPTPQIVRNWEFSNLSYKIIEKNNVWWKFSWQVTLRNNTPSIIDFLIEVNFLDRSEFIIDSDLARICLGPKEKAILKGYALITTSIAPQIRDMEADVLSASKTQ